MRDVPGMRRGGVLGLAPSAARQVPAQEAAHSFRSIHGFSPSPSSQPGASNYRSLPNNEPPSDPSGAPSPSPPRPRLSRDGVTALRHSVDGRNVPAGGRVIRQDAPSAEQNSHQQAHSVPAVSSLSAALRAQGSHPDLGGANVRPHFSRHCAQSCVLAYVLWHEHMPSAYTW